MACDEQARPAGQGLGPGVQADRLHPETKGDPDQTPCRLGPANSHQGVSQTNQTRCCTLLPQGLPF
jgi:hypothetical protein